MKSTYRSLLVIVAVLLFFSGFDTYVFFWGMLSVLPLHWILGLAVAALPLPMMFFGGDRIDRIPQRLLLWCLGFTAITVVWYFPSSQSEVASRELVVRLEACGFIVFMAYLFSHPSALRTARWTILAVVVATVGLNIYEIISPDDFATVSLDRAVGLYVNPNRCGAALGFGMTLTHDLMRPRLRLFYFLWVGLGIILTFSRAGIVGWVIAVFILVVYERAGDRGPSFWRLVNLAAPVSLLAVLVVSGGALFAAMDLTERFNDNVQNRVAFFQTLSITDDSALERRMIAARAWEAFEDHPLVGNGLGYSRELGPAGTHNMFLTMIVDHGILGVAVVPLLLLVVMRRRDPASASFAALAFCYSLFSHNLFDDRYFLISYAAMAVYSFRPREQSILFVPVAA